MSMFLTLAAAAEHGEVHLPMPAWAYGVIALGVFLLLLGFVWMFRHTARVMIEGDGRGHGHRVSQHSGRHADEGRH